MLITENDLKKLIRHALLETQSLGDVIADFSDDFSEAKKSNATAAALLSIKKNNTLLQIIFDLLSENVHDFRSFYTLSNLGNNDNKWLNEQNKIREADRKQVGKYLKTFFDKIKKNDVTAETYEKALSKLTKEIKDYIPRWIPLQVLFYFIDESEIESVVTNFSEDDNNFSKIDNKPFLMIPIEAKTKGIVQRIVTIINKTKLDDDEKQNILNKMVTNSSFRKNVEEGNWSGVTSVMDNAWNFLMTNNSGSTSKIFGNKNISSGLSDWFEETGKDFAKAAKFSNTKSPFSQINNISDTLSQAMSAIENQSPEGKEFLKNMLSDASNPVGAFFDKLLNLNDGRPVTAEDLTKAIEEIVKEFEDIGMNVKEFQKKSD